jgi:hypothetical protein
VTSSFDIDDFDGDELDEATWLGEVCTCEVRNHFDWAENIHGYAPIAGSGDYLSCCDDCLPELPEALIEDAGAAGITDPSHLSRRIHEQHQDGEYDSDLADRLQAALALSFAFDEEAA